MTTSIPRDVNSVPVGRGLLQSDGKTVTPLQADPSTHVLQTAIGTGGTDQGTLPARRDPNSVPNFMAVSSDGLGTLVPIYLNSSGQLLVKI